MLLIIITPTNRATRIVKYWLFSRAKAGSARVPDFAEPVSAGESGLSEELSELLAGAVVEESGLSAGSFAEVEVICERTGCPDVPALFGLSSFMVVLFTGVDYARSATGAVTR
ncbi:hypothetical protein [Gordonia jinhuaensis]|nr:hypothetical protein [Gordonia jinhuaensis]